MDQLENSVNKYNEIVKKINIKPEHINYHTANEKYLPFLKMLDETKTSIIVVTDFYKRNYYYTSERFNLMFGFKENKLPDMNQQWYRERFHPDDYIINVAGIEFHKFIKQQPIKEKKNFKLTHDFRIKNEANQWIRLLVQDYMLEIDTVGNPWLAMKLCDTSPIQDVNANATSVCRNIITNEIIFSLEGKSDSPENISDREKEVLSLIAEGMRSKEIAEKLIISANTVNNHRRNLLEKLNVTNSSEAVKLAIKLGII